MNKEKGRIGFTAGNFDLLHPGYIYTFETAKKHCDYFMVFLQKDPSETRYTKYKPVIPLYERYKTLMAIQYIDEVVTYQTEEELLHHQVESPQQEESSEEIESTTIDSLEEPEVITEEIEEQIKKLEQVIEKLKELKPRLEALRKHNYSIYQNTSQLGLNDPSE